MKLLITIGAREAGSIREFGYQQLEIEGEIDILHSLNLGPIAQSMKGKVMSQAEGVLKERKAKQLKATDEELSI